MIKENKVKKKLIFWLLATLLATSCVFFGCSSGSETYDDLVINGTATGGGDIQIVISTDRKVSRQVLTPAINDRYVIRRNGTEVSRGTIIVSAGYGITFLSTSNVQFSGSYIGGNLSIQSIPITGGSGFITNFIQTGGSRIPGGPSGPSGPSGPTAITSVTVVFHGIPVNGGDPSLSYAESGALSSYTVGDVTWYPDHPTFQASTIYTASVILTVVGNHTFTGLSSATLGGETAIISNNTGTSVTLERTFEATGALSITSIAITTQPSSLIYTHGDLLTMAGLEVTITYDDGSTEVVDYNNWHIVEVYPRDIGDQLLRPHDHEEDFDVRITSLPAITHQSIGTLTVNKKTLTLEGTANHTKPYDGNANAPVVGGLSLSGKIGDEDVTISSATGTYASANAGTTSLAVTVTLGGADAVNYDPPATANLTVAGITKLGVAVSATDQSIAVGGILDFDEDKWTSAPTLPLSGSSSTLDGVLGLADDVDDDEDKTFPGGIIQGTLNGGTNFNITNFTAGTLTVGTGTP